MKAHLIAVVLLTGCPEHGSGGGGGGGDGPPTPLETARFIPQVCTGGMPGDPTCPLNRVPLPMPPQAELQLVAQALGSGVFLTNIAIVAGPDGLFLEHPLIVQWNGNVDTPDPTDHYAGLTMNLPPTQIGVLDNVSFIGFDEPDQLSFRFDRLETFAAPPPDV